MSMLNDDRLRFWLPLIGLSIAVAALYARSIEFGMLENYDDGLYLTLRSEVRHWWSVSWRQRLLTPETGYPTPIPTFVYYHVRILFGSSYLSVLHGLNVGIHLLNVVLLALLVRRWSGPTMALTVAALWGLHPIDVEVVAWLTSMKTALWGTTAFGSLLLWDWRCRDLEGPAARIADVGTSLLFLFGLGCRPEAIILPLALWAISIHRHGFGWPDRFDGLVWGFMIAVATIYLPLATQGQAQVVEQVQRESGPVWRRYYRAMRALEMAVRHFVAPFDLDPEYYIAMPGSWLESLPGLAIALGLIALMVGLTLRCAYDLLLPLLLTALFYGPYSQLKPIPRLTADSYLYVPGALATYVVVVGIARTIEARYDTSEHRRRIEHVGMAIVLIATLLFSGLTHRQIGRWRNALTLWGPMLEEHTTVWKPYQQVAHGFKRLGEWEMAASVLDRGLPVFRTARRYPSFMPLVYEHLGQTERAIALAHEIVRRHRTPLPAHYVAYLELLARHNVPLRDDPDVRNSTEKALETYMSARYWARETSPTSEVVAYAERHDLLEPVIDRLRRTFDEPRPPCMTWRAADALSSSVRSELSIPTRPERCPRPSKQTE
jgi:hypothetical protein